jgi:hypothetical protein
MTMAETKPLHDPELAETLRKFEKNAIWFGKNRDKLAERFDGKCVAVYQGRVVDSDKDARTLGGRLRKDYPKNEGNQIYVGFVTKEKYNIILTQAD